MNVKIRPRVSWAGLIEAHNLRPNQELERKPCYWLMRTINICTDGRVAFCPADPHCRVPCGNVRTDTIKELWAGKLSEYRAMHRDGRYDELPEMRRTCRDWQSAYAEFFAGEDEPVAVGQASAPVAET